MELLFKLLCSIYIELLNLGFKLKAPYFLFNKPKIKNSFQIIETIHADINFSQQEREYIIQAVKNLEFFSNDLLKFDIIFDVKKHTPKGFNYLIKLNSSHNSIVDLDKKYKYKILGVCYYLKDGRRWIDIVEDRIINSNDYIKIVSHELGHFIGLNHTKRISIMHKYICFDTAYYFNMADAEEFAAVFKCNIENLRYFRS